MDYTLELIVVPVSDVDRAKAFYIDQAGFELLVDTEGAGLPGRPADPARLGLRDRDRHGISTMPGSLHGLHLVVDDIEAARDDLAGRGADVGDLPLRRGRPDAGPRPGAAQLRDVHAVQGSGRQHLAGPGGQARLAARGGEGDEAAA